MAVNRDQLVAHKVRIVFADSADHESNFAGLVELSIFGSAQYQWHPAQTRFMAHAESSGQRTIVTTTPGHADPDGPIVHSKLTATKDALYEIPAASVVVIRGKVGLQPLR